jgi:hypothetical protein
MARLHGLDSSNNIARQRTDATAKEISNKKMSIEMEISGGGAWCHRIGGYLQ